MKLRWKKPTFYRGWQAKCGILLFEIRQQGQKEFNTELGFDYGINLDIGVRYGGSIEQCTVMHKSSRSLEDAKENAMVLYERFMKEIKKPTTK